MQVQLDQGFARLEHVVFCDGVLYAQTDHAMIHAIDAETGRTLWSRQVGRADRPTMRPGAYGDRLAVINGLRLYVLNRFTGDVLYETQLKDTPGAGPALSSHHVYVPMVSGMMVAYPLESIIDAATVEARAKTLKGADEKARAELDKVSNGTPINQHTPPTFCRSWGRAMVQPLVTRDNAGGEYTVWPTDRGVLNLARIDRDTQTPALTLKYRLETGSKIFARPGYQPPDPKVPNDSGTVFVAARDGLVYAVAEESGETIWRFTAGELIEQAPAVVDERVYVTTQYGGMYCLGSKQGENLWWTPRATRFIAASKDRVYAADRLGRILVINAADGSPLDTIAGDGISPALANTDTDRIYLVSDGGLIQCLHEAELAQPLFHGQVRKEAAKAEPAVKPAKKKKESVAPAERPAPKAATPAPKRDKPKRTTAPARRGRATGQPKQGPGAGPGMGPGVNPGVNPGGPVTPKAAG
ncbi:MAG: PQQ-binding-like beta-propeller repeat protein [Thermoguttaceae bacterium]